MCLITFQGSILKETNPEYSLEGVMLKLKPRYSGHLMRRADSLEKTLMLGKTGGRTRRGRQRMTWLDGITDSMDIEFEQTPGDGEGQGSLACCSPWGRRESDTTEQLVVLQPHLFPAPSSLLDGELVYRTGLDCVLVHFFFLLSLVLSTLSWHTGSVHWRNNPANRQASERI